MDECTPHDGSAGKTASRALTWTNWAGTASATPDVVHRPLTAEEIAAAVASAAADGKRIRTWGSAHSFTPIAVADEHAIDLSGYSGITRVDRATNEVTVRAGTTLLALNAALDAHGLALVNMGDIDKQTIAGALSTGTHGTGAALGGLAKQVSALELILADGSVVRCSASESPELFAAARVGLGALGVISTVTLRCVPSFVLAAREAPGALADVLDRLDHDVDGNDHFEFYWFPHDETVLTKQNNRLPEGVEPRPLSPLRSWVEYELIENRLFGAVCRAERAIPALVRPAQRLIAATLSERDYSDVSHRVFVTNRAVRFVESEYAVPRAALPEVLAELRRAVARLSDPVAFPVEVRFAAADDVWLSTAYERDTAYVAVHQYIGMPYREYFAAFESIANAVGGRPHWGKLHTLDATALRERYPRFDDFLRVRAEVDPDGRFGNAYTDRVLGGP
ncbi:D-arabinono-1,4-lactone oxidase [Haloechinothrix salitolerans]|uniref:D-arabinono-1,4-lactone oxidase n=1 Tax=Haloechinothrix salitolerans TaxID=926830 RepID=A0ABW2BS59_9PSEU